MQHFRSLRTLIAIAIIGALALLVLAPSVTHASLVACRSDPVIVLSDGTLVDVSADIDTLLWNVTQVHYVVHIPAGLSALAVIHTPNWLTTQETFSIYADNAPHQYSSTTTVNTRNSNVSVTANMLVNLGYDSLEGVSGQALTILLRDN